MEDACCVCKVEEETIIHVLRDCTLANKVWNLLPFGKVIFGPSLAGPLSWTMYIAWGLEEEE